MEGKMFDYKVPYFECMFCGDTFDKDDPRIIIGVSSQRELCPHDRKRLEARTANVVVGC
jgi:hypothetical protein